MMCLLAECREQRLNAVYLLFTVMYTVLTQSMHTQTVVSALDSRQAFYRIFDLFRTLNVLMMPLV